MLIPTLNFFCINIITDLPVAIFTLYLTLAEQYISEVPFRMPPDMQFMEA